MNFKRLETFVWVATLGSFKKAADHLFTTQPAISNRIAGLEAELGVRLFERDTGPGDTTLTAKGQELLPYAEKIIYLSGQLRQRLDKKDIFSGILRLGASETIVHTWLPDFLKLVHDQMPKLDIELTVDTSNHLSEGLQEHSLDLAFLMGPISAPGVANQDLCSYPLVWVASPKLALPENEATLEDLAQWPIITYARNTIPFSEIHQKFRTLENHSVRYFTSSSLSACHCMTVDAVGISTLPYAMLNKVLPSGKLRIVNACWTPSDLSFTASYATVPDNPVAEAAASLAVIAARKYPYPKNIDPNRPHH